MAVFVPAEASVGDTFGGEELQAAEQRVVLRDFDLEAEQGDVHQLAVRPEESSGRGHAWNILGGTGPTAKNRRGMHRRPIERPVGSAIGKLKPHGADGDEQCECDERDDGCDDGPFCEHYGLGSGRQGSRLRTE